MFLKAVPTANRIGDGKSDPQGPREIGPSNVPPWPRCSPAALAASSTCRPYPSLLMISITPFFALICVYGLCKQNNLRSSKSSESPVRTKLYSSLSLDITPEPMHSTILLQVFSRHVQCDDDDAFEP